MSPARVAYAFIKSVIAALVLLVVFGTVAAGLILAARLITGDELEPVGEMIAAVPNFLKKLAPTFLVAWAIIIYTFVKREKSNGS